MHDVLERDKITRDLKIKVLQFASSGQMITERSEYEMLQHKIDKEYSVPGSNHVVQEMCEDPEATILRESTDEEKKQHVSTAEIIDELEQNEELKDQHREIGKCYDADYDEYDYDSYDSDDHH